MATNVTTTKAPATPVKAPVKAAAKPEANDPRDTIIFVLSAICLLAAVVILWGVFKPKVVAPAQVAPAQVAPAQVAPAQVAPAQVAPAQVASPTWLESYTISPNNGENFSITFGDWKGTGNDFYSKGDRKSQVTFVVHNTSNYDVVVNAKGANWDNGQILKPGESRSFTEANGDFRVTLLVYANP